MFTDLVSHCKKKIYTNKVRPTKKKIIILPSKLTVEHARYIWKVLSIAKCILSEEPCMPRDNLQLFIKTLIKKAMHNRNKRRTKFYFQTCDLFVTDPFNFFPLLKIVGISRRAKQVPTYSPKKKIYKTRLMSLYINTFNVIIQNCYKAVHL